MAGEDGDRGRMRLAVLIDGDNAQASELERYVEEVAKYGEATIRRVYGDWTTPHMQAWKKELHVYAFQPVQQFRYIAGKNSTDSAMIIDAMDVLYSGNVEAFCIVSSDSDYTRLATRLREAGKFVVGVGARKTPKALVSACNVFVYTENLAGARPEPRGRQKETARERPSKQEEQALEDLLERAYAAAEEEDGWASLGRIGNQLRQIDPGFDPRTYGRSRLIDLVEDFDDLFEVRREQKGGRGAVYVRAK